MGFGRRATSVLSSTDRDRDMPFMTESKIVTEAPRLVRDLGALLLGALLGKLPGHLLSDLQEVPAHAVDIAHDLFLERIVLQDAAQLDDPVAVRPTHPLVDVEQKQRLDSPRGFSGAVHQVVGVHHADDMAELGLPAGSSKSVPVEMLRLLKHADVRVFVGHELNDVTHREDRPVGRMIPRWIEANVQCLARRLHPRRIKQPLADVELLLGLALKLHARREHAPLILRIQKRQHQRHLAPLAGVPHLHQVRRAQQGVHRRARHPWQTGRGDDPDLPFQGPGGQGGRATHLPVRLGEVRAGQDVVQLGSSGPLFKFAVLGQLGEQIFQLQGLLQQVLEQRGAGGEPRVLGEGPGGPSVQQQIAPGAEANLPPEGQGQQEQQRPPHGHWTAPTRSTLGRRSGPTALFVRKSGGKTAGKGTEGVVTAL
eukprot:scaffold895_cov315-Pinguiococcus_pyrenoidosus.AAC.38